MATFEKEIRDNFESLQRQLNRLSLAPLGPVSLGPGDHIRSGELFRFDASGAYSSHRGALWNLSDLTGSFATSIEAHTNLLATHGGRLDGHDSTLSSHGTRIGTAEGRLNGHDGDISAHNTRINNAQAAANTAQSRADSAYTRAGTGISNAATAQSRADSAYTRAGTGISNAATAQSRADAAYSLASGGASSGSVVALQQEVNNLKARVASLEAWRDSLPQG